MTNTLVTPHQFVPKLIPVKDWPKLHPWPTEAGLRNLIYNKDKNGFNTVIHKVGKRILIDELAFFNWIEAQQHNKEKK
jgi:hypothetical protein